MSDRSRASVIMIGMPASGKSTYLAALYQALSVPAPNASARLARQPSMRAYLESLRESWLLGRQVGRTLPDSGELVELDPEVDGIEPLSLSMPDVAGESFEDILVKRQADAVVTDLLVKSSGILLFTHPDHERPRVLLADLRQMQQAIGDNGDLEGGAVRAFDARALPAEVHLVELLQWVMALRRDQQRTRPTCVSLLVSAWDRVDGMTPMDWLCYRMPMLRSFLEANSNDFLLRVYGVCAQGGDYALEGVADQHPSERAYVVDADGTRSADLIAPLHWAALS